MLSISDDEKKSKENLSAYKLPSGHMPDRQTILNLTVFFTVKSAEHNLLGSGSCVLQPPYMVLSLFLGHGIMTEIKYSFFGCCVVY